LRTVLASIWRSSIPVRRNKIITRVEVLTLIERKEYPR
jgi:hypothetical protein